MAEVLLTLEDVYALPEPSIQTYLQAKGWSSQNFLADRISAIIFLASDDWLRVSDRAIVQLEDFATMAGLSDEELIARVQEVGQEVTVLMTRFDLIRKLVEIEVGDLYSFGRNDYGQLGLGDTTHRHVPILVIALAGLKIKVVSCGLLHTVIITEDNNLYSFGRNMEGQLGWGDDTPEESLPALVTVPGGLKVKAVSCGESHTVIITVDNNLYSFGNNASGQLGLGNTDNKNVPTLVTTIPDSLKVKAVSCGDNHTVIITEDGNLYSFGLNNRGQLGLGSNINSNVPSLVIDLNGLKVKAASCGKLHTVIITEDGELHSFGSNEFGQLGLGLGDIINKKVPTLMTVPNDLKVKAVSCGLLHTAIITEDDNLYSFGENSGGQLGLGDYINRMIPRLVPLPDRLKVKVVSCGLLHTVIITKDDNLYSFGYNRYGQLGLGDRDDRPRPTLVRIPETSIVMRVSCGGSHTIVIAK